MLTTVRESYTALARSARVTSSLVRAHRALRPPAPRRPDPRPRCVRAAGAVRPASPTPGVAQLARPHSSTSSPQAGSSHGSAGVRARRRHPPARPLAARRDRGATRPPSASRRPLTRRRRPRRRRRHHDGLRRRLSRHPRRPLRRLGGRRPPPSPRAKASRPSATTSPDAYARSSTTFSPTTPLRRSSVMTDTNTKPSVLFVCVHNAGRSQMAAGFLREHRRRPHRSPLRRLDARRSDQPDRRRGDERTRDRHHRRAAQGADHRGRAGLRCRDHDGCGRRVPVLPRQSATRTGSSTTRPARASTRSGRSATRSVRGIEQLVSELV